MKRLFLFAAALIMAVSFNACTENPENDDNIENNGDNNQNGDENNDQNGDENNDNNNQNGDENNGGTTSNVKLVKSIKNGYSDLEFEYDSQNRLIKAEMWGMVFHYSYNGDTMTVTDTENEDEYVMKLNADGFVTSFDFDGDCNVSNTYNNGCISKITTTWDKDDERYNDFVWDNGLLSSIATTYSENTDFLIKWSFSYDTTVQPTPINIDIIHLFFDPFGDDFGVASVGFFGKQSRLYPVKVNLDDDGDKSEISIDYEFNADGTIAKAIVNWSGEDGEIDCESFEFSY